MAVSKRRTASHNKPGTGIVAIPGRQVPCERCPLRGMQVLRDFSAEELSFVSAFKSGELNIEAGTSVLLERTNSAYLYTVLVGWAFRYKNLPDGRRQILNFAVPSDFLGLQGTVANEMQHGLAVLARTLAAHEPDLARASAHLCRVRPLLGRKRGERAAKLDDVAVPILPVVEDGKVGANLCKGHDRRNPAGGASRLSHPER
jgi:hypothetical protein